VQGANPQEEIAAASKAITTMGGTLLRVVPVDSEVGSLIIIKWWFPRFGLLI
jgi:hypothetical protein